MDLSSVTTIGIQGGPGSFNEEALGKFLQKEEGPHSATIEHLLTTDRVLEALLHSRVDLGQFAIYNSLDGPVLRSQQAMEEYAFHTYFEEIARYSLPISHVLMIHPGTSLSEITHILSHPTVFEQCRETLQERYAHLQLVRGEEDYEFPARVAEHIANGQLSPSVATLSRESLASLHGLVVVDTALEDDPSNETTFMLCRKKVGGGCS